MEATDLDSGKNGEITYTIASSNAPGLFDIDSGGNVTLVSHVNFTNESSYALTIKAEDSGSPSLNTTAVVKISVISGGRD